MAIETTASGKKAQGAYFTRTDVADFLVQWAVQPETSRILEPSAGDGSFLGAIDRRRRVLGINPACVAVEKDPEVAQRAMEMYREHGVRFVAGDFFALDANTNEGFDAVVGNPPWIRAASVSTAQLGRAHAACVRSNVRLSGTASLWAPFVIHAAALLKKGGRMALVLPAELLQVDYATEVRAFLQRRFTRLVVLRFDEQIFADATVDAILVLASNDGDPGVWVGHLPAVRNLRTFERWLTRHEGTRWSPFNVEPAAVDLLEELVTSGRYATLGGFADVRIGTVTGCNDYFVLRASDLERNAIPRDLVMPTVSHPRHLTGAVISSKVLERMDAEDEAMWMLTCNAESASLIREYLAEGQARDVPGRYKCRTRTPWYSVRVEKPPDLFLAYMSHVLPRLAVNQAGAVSTNLVHGIYLAHAADRDRIGKQWITAATALSCELAGRTYGGGVLKLEPSEAKRILIPTRGKRSGLTKAEAGILERSWRARVRARLVRNGGSPPKSLLEAAA